jgi:molecular chaperone DnaK
MKKAIGIDLGTTNSVVAFKDTAVKIIRNKENEELTRSCVGLRKGEILVGTKAYLDIKRDQINTILSIKRLMGGAIKDKMVQDMINSHYYKFGITALQGGTDDAVAVVLGGKQFTPEQISSEILNKLKADAEERLGDEVTHAVITVPAYFTEKQKNATRVAAQLAGLKVQKLLAEPTAAAIAYGVDNMKAGDSKTVMIYDFGGGTFDLSILNIVDGQYMEAGTGGDRWLGGDDLDRKLQAVVLEKVSSQYKISNIKNLVENLSEKKRILFEGEIRLQTEAAKIQLSSAKTAQILVDNLLEDENGDVIDIDITITRDEFEKLVTPFIERSIELIGTLLKEVGYDITMIDNILLVGGTSCIPLVKQMLSEKFGATKIKVSDKPMLAIAEGAAILSHRMGDEFEATIEDPTAIGEISYSTNHNYYIEVADGNGFKMERVVEKQTPLPVQVSKNFKTTTNNQKIVKISIYSDVEDGKHEMQALGFYLIDDNLPIESELSFDFNIDTNENLSINVAPKGKKSSSKQIVLGRGNADHKALQTIDDLIARSVKEYRTVDGEEAFLKYISHQIKEIETKGATEIEDNKWHEIYYTSTEKFDEIKSTEQGSSEVENAVFRAKRLVIEFGELLDPFDKTAMVNLITQIETSVDETEKMQLANNLEEKTNEYGLLNSALRIESLAERILNIPGTAIGVAKKQSDVNRLKQLAVEVKTKFRMGQIEPAKTLMDEAYEIIKEYKYAF